MASANATETKQGHRITPLQSILLRLWQNPNARLGGAIVCLMVALAILVPLLDAGYDPSRDRNLRARYAEPDCLIGWGLRTLEGEWSCDHPFGADKLGRDILRRVGHGMSTSLRVGVFVVIIATSVGSLIGLLAGFLGGWFESIAMRIVDILLAFPALLLAIALVSMRGAGLMNAMYAIAITQIPIFARLARSMAISLRSSEYVLAARSLGASEFRLLSAHVFPNSLAPLIVQATLLLGTAVVETAALGFLGLGQQPPAPELGKMLAESQQSLQSGKWWVMFFPGITIVTIVLGFNLLGDALRDALDPRLRGQ
ncbi:MAG: ABC transporter permease [Anaerolineaceae bacterium]|nr:ABC transporter permease [Anaerolineaceae bacterium]